MAAKGSAPIKLTWHDALIDWLAGGPPGIPRQSPGTVLAVASARMRYASRDGTNCYPARATLAELLGYHRDTVLAVDRFLEANGWLTQDGTKGRQRTPVYRLTGSSVDTAVTTGASVEGTVSDGDRDGDRDGAATGASVEGTITESSNHRKGDDDDDSLHETPARSLEARGREEQEQGSSHADGGNGRVDARDAKAIVEAFRDLLTEIPNAKLADLETAARRIVKYGHGDDVGWPYVKVAVERAIDARERAGVRTAERAERKAKNMTQRQALERIAELAGSVVDTIDGDPEVTIARGGLLTTIRAAFDESKKNWRNPDKLQIDFPERALDDEDPLWPDAEWPDYLAVSRADGTIEEPDRKPAEAVALIERLLAHAARLGFEKQGPATQRCHHQGCDFEVTAASWGVADDELVQHYQSKHPQTPETDVPPAQPAPPQATPSAPPPSTSRAPVTPQPTLCQHCGQSYYPEWAGDHLNGACVQPRPPVPPVTPYPVAPIPHRADQW
jgi:hypothetical protein